MQILYRRSDMNLVGSMLRISLEVFTAEGGKPRKHDDEIEQAMEDFTMLTSKHRSVTNVVDVIEKNESLKIVVNGVRLAEHTFCTDPRIGARKKS